MEKLKYNKLKFNYFLFLIASQPFFFFFFFTFQSLVLRLVGLEWHKFNIKLYSVLRIIVYFRQVLHVVQIYQVLHNNLITFLSGEERWYHTFPMVLVHSYIWTFLSYKLHILHVWKGGIIIFIIILSFPPITKITVRLGII